MITLTKQQDDNGDEWWNEGEAKKVSRTMVSGRPEKGAIILLQWNFLLHFYASYLTPWKSARTHLFPRNILDKVMPRHPGTVSKFHDKSPQCHLLWCHSPKEVWLRRWDCLLYTKRDPWQWCLQQRITDLGTMKRLRSSIVQIRSWISFLIFVESSASCWVWVWQLMGTYWEGCLKESRE